MCCIAIHFECHSKALRQCGLNPHALECTIMHSNALPCVVVHCGAKNVHGHFLETFGVLPARSFHALKQCMKKVC